MPMPNEPNEMMEMLKPLLALKELGDPSRDASALLSMTRAEQMPQMQAMAMLEALSRYGASNFVDTSQMAEPIFRQAGLDPSLIQPYGGAQPAQAPQPEEPSYTGEMWDRLRNSDIGQQMLRGIGV